MKDKPEKLNGEPFVLDVCLDVHMQNTGSLSPQDDYDDNISFLKRKLEFWKPSFTHDLAFTKDFDEAVRNLIVVTLKEHEAQLAFRKEPN